jgi:glutamine amidotransferase
VTAAPVVAVLDYGSGNVHSALTALGRAGAEARLTADPDEVLRADGLIVPGVGAFGAVMRLLRAAGGERLIERRLSGGRPVLGICVGMQVLFGEGLEGGAPAGGLSQWPGTVRELQGAPRLPHMGWDTVEVEGPSRLFEGIERERFYFVHSFAATEWTLRPQDPLPRPALAWCDYGERFLAAVENGPLCATQFHPEKSGRAGIHLLRNWMRTF